MNRRLFLLSASALVLTLKLLPTTPTLAAATVGHPAYPGVPYDELVRIEEAFRILEDYQFGTVAQARLFGIDPTDIESTTELRDAACHLAIEDGYSITWKRIGYIETIRAKLDEQLGPDVNEHLFVLATNPMFRGQKFRLRDSLELGTLEELRFAAESLSS